MGEYWITSEYSRHSKYGASPGLLLVGDAYAFLDPVFSSGVMLALKSGVIAGETSTAVTLRGQENKTTTILRVDVDEMHTTGKSLMPEGFEKLIDNQAMANLITFLVQTAGKQGAGK